MNKVKVKTGDWVVVCDGRKALILENVGDHAFPVLHTKEVREHPDLSTSEQGSDGPGRVHQSMGRARSAIEQTDWHDRTERAFLTALASRLHAGLTKGETRALIVVASPRALGVIREVYSPTRAQRHPRRIRQGSREASGPRDREAIVSLMELSK